MLNICTNQYLYIFCLSQYTQVYLCKLSFGLKKLCAEKNKRSSLHRASDDINNLRTNDLKTWGALKKENGFLFDLFDSSYLMACA